MLICPTHQRQRQPVAPGLACRNVEIIILADIGDIYNIFTGQDMDEFIVRRRQGHTSYFFSRLRDPIVKVCLFVWPFLNLKPCFSCRQYGMQKES